MKAIRVNEFGGPEVLRLEEVVTQQPAPGQVLVRIHAIGVNPVETYIRAGTYARLPALPYTPGNDGAGVVEQIGDSVTEFKPGDHVYTAGSLSGTYADFALCRTDQVHRLPKNASFAQGAAMGTPYATAYRGLFQRAEAKPGETVLVHGASGGVGTAAVQLARARGLRVLGTAGSEEGRKLAREQGAHEVFDHRAPDHFEQIMNATNGRGVDVIVELLANVNRGKINDSRERRASRLLVAATGLRSIRATRCSAMSIFAEWCCRTTHRQRWRAFTPRSWLVWKTEPCVR